MKKSDIPVRVRYLYCQYLSGVGGGARVMFCWPGLGDRIFIGADDTAAHAADGPGAAAVCKQRVESDQERDTQWCVVCTQGGLTYQPRPKLPVTSG